LQHQINHKTKDGRRLTGSRRKEIKENLKNTLPHSVHRSMYAKADLEELKGGNKTSIRSIKALAFARKEVRGL